jgi:hypothetical protein
LTTKRGTLNNPNANLTEDQKRELRSDISKLENKLDNWKGMTITQANTPGATPEMIKESEKKLKTEMQRELKEKYADVAEEGIINTVLGANKAAAGAIRKAAKSKSADDDLLAAIRGANQATPPPTPPPPPVPPPPAQNCWVAEVLYGIDDQKTHAARLWATTNNNWFTKLYREHGKVWARWLSAHTWAQPIVKPIWDIMAIKGQTLAVKARTGNFSMNSEYNYLLERVK